MTSLEYLDAADALVGRGRDGRAGGWPRIAAVLGRHAVEKALDRYWRLRQPGVERCSGRAQFLCLTTYLSDRDLARATFVAWSDLSRYCHHHPYEIGPNADDLSERLQAARRFATEVERQVVDAGRRRRDREQPSSARPTGAPVAQVRGAPSSGPAVHGAPRLPPRPRVRHDADRPDESRRFDPTSD